MFFNRSKLSKEEKGFIEHICQNFILQIFSATDWGRRWDFNQMSFRLHESGGWPTDMIDRARDAIKTSAVSLLNGNLGKMMSNGEYAKADQGAHNRAQHIFGLLESRMYRDGDTEYEALAIDFVATRVNSMLINLEKALEIVEVKNEMGEYRETLEKAIGAFASFYVNTIGSDLPVEIRAAYPRVARLLNSSDLM